MLVERESVLRCVGATPLIRLEHLFPEGPTVLGKLELMNPAGSVKDRPARFIVESGLRNGRLSPESHLVESSSGNFGIALAMAARVHDLRFTCVVDPCITPMNRRILESLGAELDEVDEPDDNGGFLGSRLRRVRELVERLPDGVWVNQYGSIGNWQAHYHRTAAEIIRQLDGPLTHLVAAVSTSGTVLGLARRLRQVFPDLRVVAVDAVGSVLFGGAPGQRELPGHGASLVPELLCPDEIDQVVAVSDHGAALGCRRLAEAEGLLTGGSSGAAVAALERLLPALSPDDRVVVVFPDRGDRYLDLVYDDAWLRKAAARCSGSVAGGAEEQS